MCLMCDGYSEAEIHAQCDQLIAEYGWVVQQTGVEASTSHRGRTAWACPTGSITPSWSWWVWAPQRAIVLLNDLGRCVRNGGLFAGLLAENALGSLR